MAVYTEVPFADAAALLHKLDLGDLTDLRGIEGGIENTNYFVTSEKDGATHEHVLTVFERLSFEQLPYYLHLMKHLAGQGIPVPEPATDAQGEVLHRLLDKPAAVVDKLTGKSVLAPAERHCEAVGDMLARMHLAGRDYRAQPAQPARPALVERNRCRWSCPTWRRPKSALLRSELAYQNHVAALPAYTALPRGPVHADLFRDNAMFDGDRLTGFFDFYFAGNDSFLFDLAVCLNDWCVRHGDPEVDGQHDPALARAMLQAYQRTRPLSAGRAAAAAGHVARSGLALLALAPVGLVPAARRRHAPAPRPHAFRARAVAAGSPSQPPGQCHARRAGRNRLKEPVPE